ncbi:MAG: hypothetical protein IPM57_03355 [Oligoflexia bacterium]|nr:hypothetical protein [Oligoflexia bacterium]
MKPLSFFLFLNLLAVFAFSQEPSFTQARRTYAGGKDDSDLAVQLQRKFTRKGGEIEVDYQGYGESGEADSTDKSEPSADTQDEHQ